MLVNQDHLLTDQQVLDEEERQLRMFLTDIRPVGEEKSELYPEPQYFSLGFRAGAVVLPSLLKRITDRLGGPAEYGQRLKRVLAPTSAVHVSGLPFLATWGREMLLLEDEGIRKSGPVCFDDGTFRLSDSDVADVIRFSRTVARNHRTDGSIFPSETAALGDNYRILDPAEALQIARNATSIDQAQASRLLGLMASVRALSFLMEAETREALMVHGPYPCDDPESQLIIFECQDLRWELFPRFPLPGGVRWKLPDNPFPYANIAIAFVVRKAKIQADRFGTLYVEPMRAENIVAGSILTRGADYFTDAPLTEVSVNDATALRRMCDDVQDFMFMQIADWDYRQRLTAGVMDEQMLFLRLMAGAGFDRVELEVMQDELIASFDTINQHVFDKIADSKTEDLPFFRKLGAILGGQPGSLFTPFA